MIVQQTSGTVKQNWRVSKVDYAKRAEMPPDVKKTLGERIASLRSPRYTREALAKELGVSRNTIIAWEKGDSAPDTVNLIRVSEIFDVSLDALIGRAPLPQRPADFEDLVDAVVWLEESQAAIHDALESHGVKIALPPKPAPTARGPRRNHS